MRQIEARGYGGADLDFEYLPPELLRKGFALGVLDLAGMRRAVLGWCGEERGGQV